MQVNKGNESDFFGELKKTDNNNNTNQEQTKLTDSTNEKPNSK